MARKQKAKTSISVDFTGVESSGQVQEGRQVLTVKEVELKTSENSGNDYLNWKFGAKGGTVYHSTSLQPQTLWNLRNVLEALGMEVPESSLDLDLTEFPDLEMGAEIEHEKYQGKKKPVIIDVFPIEELEEGEESDEEESDEESDDITYEEVMEMDKEELIELAEEEEIKLTAKVKKKLDGLREFIADKLELESEEDESEEDESGSDDLTIDEINEMDQDELLEVAEEHEIKVLARVKKSVTKLRAHLIAELELEEDEPEEEEEEPAPKKKSRKKGSKTLKKGAEVTFEDDGEEIEGTVLSINTKEEFAVIDVDGEEWEVELEDIKL